METIEKTEAKTIKDLEHVVFLYNKYLINNSHVSFSRDSNSIVITGSKPAVDKFEAAMKAITKPNHIGFWTQIRYDDKRLVIGLSGTLELQKKLYELITIMHGEDLINLKKQELELKRKFCDSLEFLKSGFQDILDTKTSQSISDANNA